MNLYGTISIDLRNTKGTKQMIGQILRVTYNSFIFQDLKGIKYEGSRVLLLPEQPRSGHLISFEANAGKVCIACPLVNIHGKYIYELPVQPELETVTWYTLSWHVRKRYWVIGSRGSDWPLLNMRNACLCVLAEAYKIGSLPVPVEVRGAARIILHTREDETAQELNQKSKVEG